MSVIIFFLFALFAPLFASDVPERHFSDINLNKISVIQAELSKLEKNHNKNKELIKSLKNEQVQFIRLFLKNSVGNLRHKNAINQYNQTIDTLYAARHEAQNDKNYVAQVRYDIEIKSTQLDMAFDRLIQDVNDALYNYKSNLSLKSLFIAFQDSITINMTTYNRVYREISAKEGIKSKEKQTFLSVYHHLENQFAVYNAILDYMQNYTEEISSTESLVRFFDIGSLVQMLDTHYDKTAVAQLTQRYLGVPFGVILTVILIALTLLLLYFFLFFLLRVWIHFRYQHETEEKVKKTTLAKTFINSSLRFPLKLVFIVFALDLTQRIIFFAHNNYTLIHYFDIAYTILILWILFRLINNYVILYSDTFLKRYPSFRLEVINFFIGTLKILLLTVALIALLHDMGINISGLLASLGIGGIAIALAAKESLSNIFGSISIIMDNMFSQGDWIVTEKGQGTVVEIGLRSTKIRTFDNALTYIPNGYLSNTEVKNFSKRKLGRRIKFKVGVAYTAQIEDVMQAVEDIREMLKTHEGIADEQTQYDTSKIAGVSRITKLEDLYGISRTLLVYLDDFGENSIDILVYCFTKSVIWAEWLETKQDVLKQIAQIMDNNNLSFAFPSRSVYLSNDGESPFDITLSKETEPPQTTEES